MKAGWFAWHITAAFLHYMAFLIASHLFGSCQKRRFFVTYWSQAGQMVYMAFSAMYDIYLPSDTTKRRNTFLNTTFHLSAAFALFVSVVFWSIWSVHPELLMRQDIHYPLYLNNMQHTMPLVLIVVEQYLMQENEGRLRFILPAASVVTLAYVGNLLSSGLGENSPYPMLDSLKENYLHLLTFIGGMYLVLLCFISLVRSYCITYDSPATVAKTKGG
mmetsp:Transcript_22727/g.63893  ORF Transcript_22727/g.63893 Transcript_22727/m.63893 type:complete len:217 (+) Transcript_22727:100-750(+)